jgi:hypothetical protein
MLERARLAAIRDEADPHLPMGCEAHCYVNHPRLGWRPVVLSAGLYVLCDTRRVLRSYRTDRLSRGLHEGWVVPANLSDGWPAIHTSALSLDSDANDEAAA